MTARTWSAADVCKATGVTYRQLDYWCSTGLFGPRLAGGGSGNRRPFTDHDVALMGVLGRLVPVLLPAAGEHPESVALFRYVAQEAADMDLSHGWLVLAPGQLAWVATADELPAAWAGMEAFTVVCLDEAVDDEAEAAA